MLAKLTSKNQLTLPAELLRRLPRVEYFDAVVEGGTIVLRPIELRAAVDLEKVRDRLARAGLTEDDVRDAVRWARDGRS